MAPATPSPYRFSNGRLRRTRNEDEDDLAAEQDDLADPQGRSRGPRFSTSTRFAATPRFNHGRSAKATIDAEPRPSASLAQTLISTSRNNDQVEEPTSSFDELGHPADDTHDPYDINLPNEHPTWADNLTVSPKRRRLTTFRSTNDPDSIIRPFFKHQNKAPDSPRPTTPRFHSTITHSNSLFPSTTTSTPTPASIDETINRRPAFLRPPPSITDNSTIEPLPQIFSPHRRGQKFVPGGLAAKVQGWVVEVGQSALIERGRGDGDGFVVLLEVKEVSGVGPWFARGCGRDGGVLRVVLTLSGGNGHEMGSVSSGVVIGVRAPVWEVVVMGDRWVVGVDWRVLPG